MSSIKKIVVLSIVVLVLVAGFGVWVMPQLLHPTQKAKAAATLPYNATANGPYSVQGNKIIGTDGQQYIFHGIGRDGLEYNC